MLHCTVVDGAARGAVGARLRVVAPTPAAPAPAPAPASNPACDVRRAAHCRRRSAPTCLWGSQMGTLRSPRRRRTLTELVLSSTAGARSLATSRRLTATREGPQRSYQASCRALVGKREGASTLEGERSPSPGLAPPFLAIRCDLCERKLASWRAGTTRRYILFYHA